MTAGTPGQPASEYRPEDHPALHLVQLLLCDSCIDGEGEECHTPGCCLWMNRPPEREIRSDPRVTVLPDAEASAYALLDDLAEKVAQAQEFLAGITENCADNRLSREASAVLRAISDEFTAKDPANTVAIRLFCGVKAERDEAREQLAAVTAENERLRAAIAGLADEWEREAYEKYAPKLDGRAGALRKLVSPGA